MPRAAASALKRETQMSEIKYTSDSAFEADVLSLRAGAGRLLGEWCGPCRMIGAILDEVSNEYQGKIT